MIPLNRVILARRETMKLSFSIRRVPMVCRAFLATSATT
jgi:hypothetical protein